MSLLTGLQAYWAFDESSGNATDSSGNSNTLTNNNSATYTTGVLGNAATLVGTSSQSFSIADNAFVSVVTGWSLSFWFRLDSSQTGGSGSYYSLYGKRTGENGILGYTENVSGTWRLYIASGTGSFSGAQVSGLALSLDTWYHCVVYYNSSSTKVYVNGTEYTISLPNITDPSSAFQIGAGSGYPTHRGKIDEFGIWDRELTSDDVSSLYNSGAGLAYPLSSGSAPNSNFLMFM
jgi:hypothetical protein